MVDFVQNGLMIDYVNNTGAAISYGDVVVLNDQTFIAAEAIADGATGSLRTEGVFDFVAATGDTFTQGDLVYYDESEGAITATATGNIKCGWAFEDKATGVTVLAVKLGREFVEADSAAAAMVGTLAELTTEDQTDAVNAINEVDANCDANKTELAKMATSNSTITIAAASGVTQAATIQLKDMDDANLTSARAIRAYMCTDANGLTKSSAGVNTSVTVSTGTELLENTAKLDLDILTDATGQAVLTFDNTSGSGSYEDRVAVILPNGQLIVSDALAVPNA